MIYEATFAKRAVIRDPNVPIGRPARMWIDCGCGSKVDMTERKSITKCSVCETIYDSRGCILKRAARD